MIFVKIRAIENGWMVDIDSASDEPAIVACCYIVVLCRIVTVSLSVTCSDIKRWIK